jgi:hypothetical protein
MKSGLSRSLLAIATAALGMGGTQPAAGSPSRAYKLRPPVGGGLYKSLTLVRALPNPISQSPLKNQRKARKARRARFAAGDRQAFRRA